MRNRPLAPFLHQLAILLALAPAVHAEEGPRSSQQILLLPADVSTATATAQPAQIAPNAASPTQSPAPAAAAVQISTPTIATSPAPAVSASTPTAAAAAPAPPQVSTAPFVAPVSASPERQASTSTAAAARPPERNFGTPLDPNRGPWLVGEVVSFGNSEVSSYSILERLRARRGALYTPSDLASDAKEALSVPGVLGARAEIYGMAEESVPENYASITVSTMMARVVIRVEEKRSLAGVSIRPQPEAAPAASKKYAPAPLSGALLTPTAYRGTGRHNAPGIGLDINAAYYIGRLYGKNSVDARTTNYIDRIGLWFLTADGKAQIQSETKWRPAVAVGGQGTFMLRDAPQPSLQTTNNVTVNVSQNTTKLFSGGYFVATKNLFGLRTSLGYMYGNAGEEVSYLTEFLSPQALQFLYLKGADVHATSKSTLFASLIILPSAQHPMAVEIIKPNGMVLNPVLLNFKVGYFLKFNFDVAYLRFQGGYDLLGLIQFRFNQFPRN